MCGFVAIVNSDATPIDAGLLGRMTARLAHRGPDDTAYAWIRPADGVTLQWTRPAAPPAGSERMSGVLLGHCRLSILDPSERSRQPMASADGSSWVVYNGEIYNYLELRSELAALGARFRSDGDTEVLLTAYERWGDNALTRLNGMWAFVLWDARRRRLLVARDRFGIKPLYYTTVGETWIFASELKAILQFPGIETAADDREVMSFLRNDRIDSAAATLFRGIRAVTPGTALVVEGDRLAEHRYWTLPHRETPARSSADLVSDYQSLLADSVRLRMRADVAIGTMLSGGLDSTSIAAFVERHRRAGHEAGRGDAGPLRTFSSCWPGAPMDEEAAIRLVAGTLGLDSRVIYPEPAEIRDLLPVVTRHLEEPFTTPVAVVQYMLMREARRAGVKVVLNGHGSDEVLGGYQGAVLPMHLATLLVAGRLGDYRRERDLFGGIVGVTRMQRAAAVLTAVVGESGRAWVARQLARLPESDGLLIPAPRSTPVDIDETFGPPGHLSAFDGVLWRLFIGVLPKWLRMEDRVSMAHSVESRLPFLDYRLVELAFALPQSLKMRNGYTKYVLRQAMRPFLPDAILLHRRKQQFTAPFAGWFHGPWRDFAGDLLLTGTPRCARFLDGRGYKGRVGRYLGGASGAALTRASGAGGASGAGRASEAGGASGGDALDPSLLWRVLHTEIWMREYGL